MDDGLMEKNNHLKNMWKEIIYLFIYSFIHLVQLFITVYKNILLIIQTRYKLLLKVQTKWQVPCLTH